MKNIDRLCLGCMNDSGGEKICPICGFDASIANPKDHLPLKFVLDNRFIVGKTISTDAEGITYIGWDNGSDSIVTIKEYFPPLLAHRNADKTVSIIDGNQYSFNEGLLDFLEVNRIVKSSELPALVPIEAVFEENGTVYSVAAKISGITLKEFLEKNGGTLKWEQARALFLPLIDTIKGMNDNGIVHGSISENTIIVGRDGTLRITGYGIKRVITKKGDEPSVICDGFAAVEQYGIEGLHNDTYTDVYGLCATLFRVLIGMTPAVAPNRIDNDSMTIPARFAEELPRHVLAALANGLQVLPKNRTKNIEILKNELVYGEIQVATPPVEKKVAAKAEAPKAKKKKGGNAKYVVLSAICTVLVFLAVAVALILTVFKDDVFGTESSSSQESSSFNAPSVDAIGTVDSGAEITAKLHKVPNLKGKYFSEISGNEEYEAFKFVITDKDFSTEEKGTVISQSVEAGSEVARDTEIQLVISLGPKEIKIASVVGKEKDAAILELLKQGFLYENITFEKKYDSNKEPGVVLEQIPEYGKSVSTDISVKVFLNSYEGDENESKKGSSQDR